MQQASQTFAPDLARGHLIVQKQRKNLGAVIAVTVMAIVLIAGAQWIWIAVYPVTPTGIAFVVIGVLLLVVSAIANLLLVQRLASRFPEVKGAVWQGIVFGMVVPLLGAFCCILPVSFGQSQEVATIRCRCRSSSSSQSCLFCRRFSASRWHTTPPRSRSASVLTLPRSSGTSNSGNSVSRNNF